MLSGATLVGQAASIVALPIIGRCYTPAEFGTYSVYASIVSVLAVMATLRYDVAVPLPERDGDARQLLAACLLSTVIVAGVIAAGVGLVWMEWIPGLAQLRALGPYVWLVPVGVALMGFFQSLSSWAVRDKNFGGLAMTKMSQGVAGAFVQVALGLVHAGPAGLILGYMVGQAAGVGRLARQAHSGGRPGDLRWKEIRGVAWHYRQYPLFALPAGLLGTASVYLPPLLLAAMFGAETSGLFAWSQRVLAVPAMLVGNAVCQVYFGHVARAAHEDPAALVPLFHATVRRLAVVAVPFLIGAQFSPALFALVFGEPWREAGVHAQALSVAAAAGFIVVPASMLTTLGYSFLQLAWDAGRFATIIVSFAVCARLGLSPHATVLVYAINMTCWYVLLWFANDMVVRRPRAVVSRRGELT